MNWLDHLPILPVVLPLIAGIALLMLRQDRPQGEHPQGVRRRVPRCWAATLPQRLAAYPLRVRSGRAQ